MQESEQPTLAGRHPLVQARWLLDATPGFDLKALTVFVSKLHRLLEWLSHNRGVVAYFKRRGLVCQSSIKWVCDPRRKSPGTSHLSATFQSCWLTEWAFSVTVTSFLLLYLASFFFFFLRIPFEPQKQSDKADCAAI